MILSYRRHDAADLPPGNLIRVFIPTAGPSGRVARNRSAAECQALRPGGPGNIILDRRLVAADFPLKCARFPGRFSVEKTGNLPPAVMENHVRFRASRPEGLAHCRRPLTEIWSDFGPPGLRGLDNWPGEKWRHIAADQVIELPVLRGSGYPAGMEKVGTSAADLYHVPLVRTIFPKDIDPEK
jgi:hypothetical protein